MTNLLALESVSVAYDQQLVVENISFQLQAGEIGCLLGGSGSGKSTLLRVIAGFEKVSQGEVRLRAESISRPGFVVAPHLRGIGMVFQDHALFPHLSVADNIAFGLRSVSRAQKRARVAELLAMVALEGRGRDYPHQLSGGQQQRVALARALAPKPALILLDEPFASLDTELRQRLAMDVRSLLQHSRTTALLVTHDQQEAFAMADRIGVLAQRRLQQWDSAYQLYHQPANRTVAGFIGEGMLVPVRRLLQYTKAAPSAVSGQLLSAEADDVLVRPDDVLHNDHSDLKAEVVRRQFRGSDFLYTLRMAGGLELLSLVPSHHDHQIGEWIGIEIRLQHVIIFAAEE